MEPTLNYYWEKYGFEDQIYAGDEIEVVRIRRKSDNKEVVIKHCKITTQEGNPRCRREEDWLNEINIHKITEDFDEILKMFDAFRYDRSLYMVTEPCICDL